MKTRGKDLRADQARFAHGRPGSYDAPPDSGHVLKEILTEARGLDAGERTLRKFGPVVGGVFAAIGLFLLWRSDWSGAVATGLTSFGGLLILLGAVAPVLLRGFYRLWMTFALALGWVMTRVLLTLVFYLVVSPIALILRLVGKDPMHRRPDPGLDTYWIKRSPEGDRPERLEKFY